MAIQFAYRDESGFVYAAHPTLAFQVGLTPGRYDTATRSFTPTGNPLKQVGTIVRGEDKDGNPMPNTGLVEDKGADVKSSGIYFDTRVKTQPDPYVEPAGVENVLPDADAEKIRLEAQQASAMAAEYVAPQTEPATQITRKIIRKVAK